MVVRDRKKKDDDYVEDQHYVTGLVEMELSLVTADEAERDPVGKKRKKPNHVACREVRIRQQLVL